MRPVSPLSTWIHLSLLLLFGINFPYANPVAPMPITRLSYQDQEHWVVEFNLKQLGFYDKMPAVTDAITLGCAQSSSSNIQMQQCVLPVNINADSGTGTVVSMHFPKLKLQPGMTVFMGLRGDSYPNRGPELPANLQPNSTLTLTITRTTCTDYISPDIVTSYDCTKREYVLSKCPAYTRGTGRIHGILTDRRKKPLSSFSVTCYNDMRKQPLATAQTDGSGAFQLGSLDPCPPHTLQFVYNTFRTDYTIEPLDSQGGAPVELLIQIEYPPVGTTRGKNTITRNASPVRILSTSGLHENPIVIAVSDNTLSGSSLCELYTLSGELIRSLLFTCLGTGTYSVAWDGCNSKGLPASSATILCRISIGQELVCKSIIGR